MKQILCAVAAAGIMPPSALWAVKPGKSYYVQAQTLYLRRYASTTARPIEPPLRRHDRVTVVKVKRMWAKVRGRTSRSGSKVPVKGWCLARHLSSQKIENELRSAGTVGQMGHGSAGEYMATAGSRAVGNMAWLFVKSGKATKVDAKLVDRITNFKLNKKNIQWLARTGKLGKYMEVD